MRSGKKAINTFLQEGISRWKTSGTSLQLFVEESGLGFFIQRSNAKEKTKSVDAFRITTMVILVGFQRLNEHRPFIVGVE